MQPTQERAASGQNGPEDDPQNEQGMQCHHAASECIIEIHSAHGTTDRLLVPKLAPNPE